jgi:hypothetical protein
MKPMNTLLLLIVIALGLGGCQLSLPRAVVVADPLAMAKAAIAPKPPLGRLDCDRDGLVSLDELQDGLDVNGHAVPASEFAHFDGNADAHWSEPEFQAYLNRREVTSWRVREACPGLVDVD